MSRLRTLRVSVGVMLAMAIGMGSGVVLSGSPFGSGEQGTQENVFLNQRLRILEQRLDTIASSINQLQQAVSSQRASDRLPADGLNLSALARKLILSIVVSSRSNVG